MSLLLRLRDFDRERVFDLDSRPVSIGGQGEDLEVAGLPISGTLALIGSTDGRLFVQRVLSASNSNGAASTAVFLDEEKVEASRWVGSRGQIRIGSLRIHLEERGADWLGHLESIGENAPPGEPERIDVTPYRYERPLPVEPPTRRMPWLFGAALLVLLGIATALVLLVTSVGIEFEPEADETEISGGPFVRFGGRWLMRSGPYALRAIKEGYFPIEESFEIGAGYETDFDFVFVEKPGILSLSTLSQTGAKIFLDDALLGVSPLENEPLRGGEYALRVTAPRFRDFEDTLIIEGKGRSQTLEIQLDPAWAEYVVLSKPTGAALSVDDRVVGTTPTAVELMEGERSLSLRLPGYEGWSESVVVAAEDAKTLGPIELKRLPKATRPKAPRPRPAPAGNSSPKKVAVVPESFPPELRPKNAPVLRFVRGGEVQLGTPRGQQGRRANERVRQVTLERPFYVATHEVNNQQFQAFRPKHNSGTVRNLTLRGSDQPVTNVMWKDAAAYCNWLSKQEGLSPAYVAKGDALVSVDPMNDGYRLPTEAEWAFVAKTGASEGGTARYPWGAEFPPPAGRANLADRNAERIASTVLSQLDDGFAVSAPVGRFAANRLGFFDLAGNLSEWTHDRYATAGSRGLDPMGPDGGREHVVRGSSFLHGSLTQLRIAYREGASSPRPDLGFRIARYAK